MITFDFIVGCVVGSLAGFLFGVLVAVLIMFVDYDKIDP